MQIHANPCKLRWTSVWKTIEVLLVMIVCPAIAESNSWIIEESSGTSCGRRHRLCGSAYCSWSAFTRRFR